MIRALRLTASVAALLSLAACGGKLIDDFDPPEMASFGYSGDATGYFSARGAVPADGAPWASAFAGAYRESDGYVVTAYAPTTGTRGNRLVIATSGPVEPGTYSSDCDGDPASRCLLAVVALNMDPGTAGTDPGEIAYVADHVTFTVDSGLKEPWLTAHFSGTFVNGGRTLNVSSGNVMLPLLTH
ncbi:MAG TPA: hypothetical protein VFH27_02260 [Longimicrobiaceae bacterium]|nr:hypothetical protein [Longimicrobiaceae bacterium]